MEPTSGQELKRMYEDGTISKDEFKQLKEAMQEKQAKNDYDSKKMSDSELAFRKKMLIYGLTVSIIGLPIGLLLSLPYVWGLSIAGIVVSIIKMKKYGIIK